MNIFLTVLKKTTNIMAFRTIEITFVLHETENTENFLSHLCNILDLSLDDFNIKNTEGHHGNNIKLVSVHLIRDRVNDIAKKIISSLSIDDLSNLSTNLINYLDDKFNLYLRFDKQAIIDNNLAISYDDSVRIKMKPKNKLNETKAIKSYNELLSEYN
ncbi:MAG: hypothetical protein CMO19_01530 [Thaumarchaeota archaeon]|nr:hypothetical protein [Nitrososphaerota archaeon]|tara:strand:- start:225 stop:698 length:474 start_codon:yes stop_codon:yes gene_type:complete